MPDRRFLVGDFPLVVPGGYCAELLQLAEAALDGVALRVSPDVEGRRPGARAAAVAAVGFLVLLDGDDCLDPALAQVSAVAAEEYALSPNVRVLPLAFASDRV